MSQLSVDGWKLKLADSGIKQDNINVYAQVLSENKFQVQDIASLSTEDWKTLSITALGDIKAIIRVCGGTGTSGGLPSSYFSSSPGGSRYGSTVVTTSSSLPSTDISSAIGYLEMVSGLILTEKEKLNLFKRFEGKEYLMPELYQFQKEGAIMFIEDERRNPHSSTIRSLQDTYGIKLGHKISSSSRSSVYKATFESTDYGVLTLVLKFGIDFDSLSFELERLRDVDSPFTIKPWEQGLLDCSPVSFLPVQRSFTKYALATYYSGSCVTDISTHSAADLQLLALMILFALSALHDLDLAHGDVKPQNILYSPKQRFILCDFESVIAFGAKLKIYTRAYNLQGEKGSKPISSATYDITCLGATIFYLRSGKNLTHEMIPKLSRWQVEPELVSIVQQCFEPSITSTDLISLILRMTDLSAQGLLLKVKDEVNALYSSLVSVLRDLNFFPPILVPIIVSYVYRYYS